jgi:predicted CXXCH cytochrome family protein
LLAILCILLKMKLWKSLILAAFAITGFLVVSLAILIERGFRATSTPPSFERAVARKVRNISIPWRERRARNPVAGSSEAWRNGREEFLIECSACHGINGDGRTEMAVSLYPRAPDLRSSESQSLTDGELHYIIENGVSLTGMPAWQNTEHVASGSIWDLVVFIRSLSRSPTENLLRDSNVGASRRYTGSEACEKCHAEIYERWKKTPMANVVRDRQTHPEAVASNLETNTVAPFRKEQVAFVYGSIWKQRYFTKIGDDYFPLPAQWDFATKQWLPYHVPAHGADWWTEFYPPDNMKRPTGPTCDGCHSVNYDIQTKRVAEWNVGCEACHGPGSEHVAHPASDNIWNPGRKDPIAANDTCIRCHSQGRPRKSPIEGRYYDWPVGYRVGLRLQDYWKLEDCEFGQTDFYYFPDCTAHKNRMQGNDFVQSVMYGHGIKCSSCHDVHGTENRAQLRKPGNQLCLECHGPTLQNGPHEATLEEHTHHRDGSAGSDCVACHMPKIEAEGVPGEYVHAHTFRFIPPGMTDQYHIPNPCTTCHSDKSTSWAEEAMSHWPEWPSWKVR